MELSFRCNLKCKFCYAGDIQKKDNYVVNYFDLKTKDEIIFNLKRIFIDVDLIYSIDILGGESLLNKNFFFIISYIRKNFNIKEISLTTNGTLLNEEIISKLKDIGISEFRISLHGLEKKHNFLVGNEVFNLVINTLKILSNNNLNFTLIFVYNNINKKELLYLLLYLKNNGIFIKRIFIEFVEISGFGLKNIGLLNILYDDKLSSLFNKQLFYIEKIFKNIDIALSNYPKCKLKEKYFSFIDENSFDGDETVFYYPRLARKVYKGFTKEQILKIEKKHLNLGYKKYFRKKLNNKFILNKCRKCLYKDSCFLLENETILFEYLKFDFNKRLSYFQINKII